MYCGNRLAKYLYKNRKQPNTRCLWKRILIQSMTAKRELRFTFLFLFYYDLNWQNKKDSTHLSKMVVLLGILKTLIRKFHSHFFYSPFPKGYIQWKQCQSREWSWCIALPFPFLIIIWYYWRTDLYSEKSQHTLTTMNQKSPVRRGSSRGRDSPLESDCSTSVLLNMFQGVAAGLPPSMSTEMFQTSIQVGLYLGRE